MLISLTRLPSSYDVLLLALLSSGALAMLIHLQSFPRLHHYLARRIRLHQLGLLNWTAMLLVSAKVTHHTNFMNVGFLWAVGSVLMLVISSLSPLLSSASLPLQLLRLLPRLGSPEADALFHGLKQQHAAECA